VNRLRSHCLLIIFLNSAHARPGFDPPAAGPRAFVRVPPSYALSDPDQPSSRADFSARCSSGFRALFSFPGSTDAAAVIGPAACPVPPAAPYSVGRGAKQFLPLPPSGPPRPVFESVRQRGLFPLMAIGFRARDGRFPREDIVRARPTSVASTSRFLHGHSFPRRSRRSARPLDCGRVPTPTSRERIVGVIHMIVEDERSSSTPRVPRNEITNPDAGQPGPARG